MSDLLTTEVSSRPTNKTYVLPVATQVSDVWEVIPSPNHSPTITPFSCLSRMSYCTPDRESNRSAFDPQDFWHRPLRGLTCRETYLVWEAPFVDTSYSGPQRHFRSITGTHCPWGTDSRSKWDVPSPPESSPESVKTEPYVSVFGDSSELVIEVPGHGSSPLKFISVICSYLIIRFSLQDSIRSYNHKKEV